MKNENYVEQRCLNKWWSVSLFFLGFVVCAVLQITLGSAVLVNCSYVSNSTMTCDFPDSLNYSKYLDSINKSFADFNYSIVQDYALVKSNWLSCTKTIEEWDAEIKSLNSNITSCGEKYLSVQNSFNDTLTRYQNCQSQLSGLSLQLSKEQESAKNNLILGISITAILVYVFFGKGKTAKEIRERIGRTSGDSNDFE